MHFPVLDAVKRRKNRYCQYILRILTCLLTPCRRVCIPIHTTLIAHVLVSRVPVCQSIPHHGSTTRRPLVRSRLHFFVLSAENSLLNMHWQSGSPLACHWSALCRGRIHESTNPMLAMSCLSSPDFHGGRPYSTWRTAKDTFPRAPWRPWRPRHGSSPAGAEIPST